MRKFNLLLFRKYFIFLNLLLNLNYLLLLFLFFVSLKHILQLYNDNDDDDKAYVNYKIFYNKALWCDLPSKQKKEKGKDKKVKLSRRKTSSVCGLINNYICDIESDPWVLAFALQLIVLLF
jgi:hypothetical protein